MRRALLPSEPPRHARGLQHHHHNPSSATHKQPKHSPSPIARPFNLPSRRKESGGQDPHLKLVPLQGPTWGGHTNTPSTTIAAVELVVDSDVSQRAEEARRAAEQARQAEADAARAVEEATALALAAKERAERATSEPRLVAQLELVTAHTPAHDDLLKGFAPGPSALAVGAVGGVAGGSGCMSWADLSGAAELERRPVDWGPSQSLFAGPQPSPAHPAGGESPWPRSKTAVLAPPLGPDEALAGCAPDEAELAAPSLAASDELRPPPTEPPLPHSFGIPVRRGPTLAERIHRIREELQLPMNSPMAAAVKAANETMGLEPVGPIPDQVSALLAAMGLEEPPDELTANAAPLHADLREGTKVLVAAAKGGSRGRGGGASHGGGPSTAAAVRAPPTPVQLQADAARAFKEMNPAEKAAHYARVRARIMGTEPKPERPLTKLVGAKGPSAKSDNWRAKAKKGEQGPKEEPARLMQRGKPKKGEPPPKPKEEPPPKPKEEPPPKPKEETPLKSKEEQSHKRGSRGGGNRGAKGGGGFSETNPKTLTPPRDSGSTQEAARRVEGMVTLESEALDVDGKTRKKGAHPRQRIRKGRAAARAAAGGSSSELGDVDRAAGE